MIEWYKNLAQREQQFLSFGAAIVVLLFSYLLIYEPMQNGIIDSQKSLDQKQTDFRRLVEISNQYKKLSSTVSKTSSKKGNKSLLAVIDQSGSVAGIKSSIKRLTPEGKNKVRVRVENVSFDKLVKWLVTNSTKNLIHAELFLVRLTDKKGVVNATLLLSQN
jgi:general secretion pathway protein M